MLSKKKYNIIYSDNIEDLDIYELQEEIKKSDKEIEKMKKRKEIKYKYLQFHNF
jgi:hypothetical protein